jgi:hypothetical protein
MSKLKNKKLRYRRLLARLKELEVKEEEYKQWWKDTGREFIFHTGTEGKEALLKSLENIK